MNEISPCDANSKVTMIFEHWVEYYLILTGYVIGFGSFWRFPYLVYENGGGIFILIFLIMLFLFGLPLFYLETFLGQIYKRGPVEVFEHLHKKYKGVGIAMTIVTWLLSSYYCIILVYAYYYFFASFISPLPWSNEGKVDDNGNPLPLINTEYFSKNVLRITDSIENLGSLDSYKFICLVCTFVSIYFCIAKGILTSSKVVYVTAPAPIFMMLILFFK